ncbi:MAG TPA: peptidoglycan DD-metalloendopeptidase family protein [Solirubrobacteraceae bacterium]
MPPRPHPLVLASLAFGCAVVMALVLPHHAAGATGWRWPLRGPVVGAFHVSPRAPFARGQRRGIDLSARPGAVVRAACPGRVTFTGALPHRGLAVSVRCGPLTATYLGLGRLATRTGSRVAPGDVLGTLGATGRLRLGARRLSDRRGYVDPLELLADGTPPLPHLGPAPRALRRRPLPPTRPAPRPIAPATPPAPGSAATPHRLPWPAYPALALVASALPVGGLLHRRRRRTGASVADPLGARS